MFVEVTVSDNVSIGIEFTHVCQQIQQRVLLILSACVFVTASLAATAYIADADRVGIIALTMRAYQVDVSPFVDASIKMDDVVVANIAPTIAKRLWCGVPTSDVVDGIVSALRRVRAVDDDIVDSSLRLLQPRWYQLRQSCRPNDAVSLQSILLLEVYDCFLCDFAKYTIRI